MLASDLLAEYSRKVIFKIQIQFSLRIPCSSGSSPGPLSANGCPRDGIALKVSDHGPLLHWHYDDECGENH